MLDAQAAMLAEKLFDRRSFMRRRVIQQNDDRPAQASAHGEARTEVHLDGRLLVTSSTLDLDGDETSLHYRFRRELRSDGLLICERTWDRRFPRHPW